MMCFTQRVLAHLNLEPSDYSANPSAKGIKAQNTLKALRDVLGYRLYFDLQRGWRINNPNIEQLGLLEIGYSGLMECCEDEEEWRDRHPLLGIDRARRPGLLSSVSCWSACGGRFASRRSTSIRTSRNGMRNRSFNELKEPWGLSEDEIPFSHAFMVPRPSKPVDAGPSYRLHHVSHRSAFGRKLKSTAYWGAGNPTLSQEVRRERLQQRGR